ncbi:hypothetical protein ABEB36_013168 [Hypothenemus hampei]|uniref:Uncharacterized protein n=1 Tax=Hypothenemus hampei TaxID=57062 RepID=A0ABD1EBH7_HYPHA
MVIENKQNANLEVYTYNVLNSVLRPSIISILVISAHRTASSDYRLLIQKRNHCRGQRISKEDENNDGIINSELYNSRQAINYNASQYWFCSEAENPERTIFIFLEFVNIQENVEIDDDSRTSKDNTGKLLMQNKTKQQIILSMLREIIEQKRKVEKKEKLDMIGFIVHRRNRMGLVENVEAIESSTLSTSILAWRLMRKSAINQRFAFSSKNLYRSLCRIDCETLSFAMGSVTLMADIIVF